MNYFLKYRIGNIHFATSIDEIKEIARPKEILTNSNLPKNISGFFILRGERVLLFDLPNFLGIESGDRYEVLIAEILKKFVGFKVNEVLGIVTTEKIIPFPEIVQPKEYLKGIIKQDKEFLQIISLTKIISGARLGAIKKYLNM